jgi:hypothetical protein
MPKGKLSEETKTRRQLASRAAFGAGLGQVLSTRGRLPTALATLGAVSGPGSAKERTGAALAGGGTAYLAHKGVNVTGNLAHIGAARLSKKLRSKLPSNAAAAFNLALGLASPWIVSGATGKATDKAVRYAQDKEKKASKNVRRRRAELAERLVDSASARNPLTELNARKSYILERDEAHQWGRVGDRKQGASSKARAKSDLTKAQKTPKARPLLNLERTERVMRNAALDKAEEAARKKKIPTTTTKAPKKISKKTLALLGVGALGLGAAGALAKKKEASAEVQKTELAIKAVAAAKKKKLKPLLKVLADARKPKT